MIAQLQDLGGLGPCESILFSDVYLLAYCSFTSLIVFAFVMLTGVLSTLLLTETMQKPLELLSHDDSFMYGATGRTEDVVNAYEDHVPLSPPTRRS